LFVSPAAETQRKEKKEKERTEKIAENPPSCEDQPVRNKNKKQIAPSPLIPQNPTPKKNSSSSISRPTPTH